MNSRSISLLLLGLVACAPNAGTGSSGSGGAKPGTGGTGGIGTGGTGTGGAGTGGEGTAGTGGTGTGGIGTAGRGGAGTGGVGVGGAGTGGRGTGGAGTGGAATGGAGGGGTGAGGAAISTLAVVTDRYDIARSGSNMNETILNTTNVNRTTFGLLFSRTISGFAFGQPLYVGGVTIGGVKHNVVYVATEHDMIYAFDADAAAPDVPLWSRSLGTSVTLGAGAAYNPGCTDMLNEVGITSTPVISVADNKIYVVAKTTVGQDLHSMDLATGADTLPPVPIGNMAMPAFDSHSQLSRAGLLLMGGVVYIAYSSHCDIGPYHGWVFGYDAQTLQLRSLYNSTPSGTQGSIWQSGAGLAGDGTSIWASVGNGTQDAQNMGNNVIRLTPAGTGMTVAAHFPSRVASDNDLQSGATLLGTSGQIVSGGKDGVILLLNQSDLAMRQMVPIGGELNSFAFWNGSAGPTLYAWPVGGALHSYTVAAGSLTDKGSNTERQPGHPSGIFTVSSNGATAGTGIVWASIPNGDAWHMTVSGFLYAFDASNVARASLWSSNLVAADALGNYAKYSPPTVANGKVYVATFSGKLQVYGLK